MTWKLAHSSPAGFSLGKKLRRQQLSRESGVVSRSDGNSQASGRRSGKRPSQSLIQALSPSPSAAHLFDLKVLGLSVWPR
jgi:hypothetical protein